MDPTPNSRSLPSSTTHSRACPPLTTRSKWRGRDMERSAADDIFSNIQSWPTLAESRAQKNGRKMYSSERTAVTTTQQITPCIPKLHKKKPAGDRGCGAINTLTTGIYQLRMPNDDDTLPSISDATTASTGASAEAVAKTLDAEIIQIHHAPTCNPPLHGDAYATSEPNHFLYIQFRIPKDKVTQELVDRIRVRSLPSIRGTVAFRHDWVLEQIQSNALILYSKEQLSSSTPPWKNNIFFAPRGITVKHASSIQTGYLPMPATDS